MAHKKKHAMRNRAKHIIAAALPLLATLPAHPANATAPDGAWAGEKDIVLAVVDQGGGGDYTSIQAAIDAVPDGCRGIIYIRPGVYEENVYSGTKKLHDKYISLVGEDRETTILTSSVDRGKNNPGNKYYDCAALNVYTPRFYGENLTIRNTSGNVGQAEALFTAGDGHVFRNCLLSGYQDTHKSNVGARGYFTGCTIEGATDFIYGSGLEWFEGCEIRCVKAGLGYVTAPGDASVHLTEETCPGLGASPFHAGLFFRNCDITAEEGVEPGAYYLGRPWKRESGSTFIKCRLGDHINPLGWKDWSGSEEATTMCEYMDTDMRGNPVDTSGRAGFSRQATDTEARQYLTPERLFAMLGGETFDYAAVLRGTAAPRNFRVGDTGIAWDGDGTAAGYLVYRNGEFVAFTREASCTKDAGDRALYTVRSVSRHGVTSDAVLAAGPTLAFPTAEGFGKFASGGRGGKVVRVTSLADSGEGSLRWAFSQYPGEPITIVFCVSGEIRLESDLRVRRSNWTLAGQTAPGEGIVITHNKVNFGGSENFIVRNVRFRIGQRSTSGEILPENSMGAENCVNFIVDHCTFGWSVEENLNTADSHFLTVQYCMVHEGLYNAGHSKGARGYGSQWGGSPATYHHNLLAHNNSRSPRLNGARGEDDVVFLEYANNVNYNWGSAKACYGGENTARIAEYDGLNSAHECNFMNNYYKPGPESPMGSCFVQSNHARKGATSWGPAKWYIAGNVMEGDSEATRDNWRAVSVETYTLDDIRVDERIVTKTPYHRHTDQGDVGTYDPETFMLRDLESAEEAYGTVVARAGTVNRDAIERRVASDVLNGTHTHVGSVSGRKGIIDLETDAEGFIGYSMDYSAPLDTDLDGMPDEWEALHGLDPHRQDNNRANADGYTALEVYINGLMGEEMDDHFAD